MALMQFVYGFGKGQADGSGAMRDVLGARGAGLAEMSRAGVPVPPGFTIITDVCNIFSDNDKKVPGEVDDQIWKALAQVEKLTGKKFGDAADPLLLSVRSGAKFSMPGMMNTILNLGLNDETTEGLAAKTGNPRFAYDCYRRFIQMFGEVSMGIEMEHFDEVFDARKVKIKAKLDTDLSDKDLKAVIDEYKKVIKKYAKREFPQDVREQLIMSRNAVFMSWWAPRASYYRKMENISDRLGTACNIQAMVFGNMGDTSCTGVSFTRDPGSGEKIFYGEFLVNAQGEDVVAGIRTPQPISELEAWNADVYKQLREITANLEKHYKDMQDFEFTVQEGMLYMLQTRNGKRTGPAAAKVAVDMVAEGLIGRDEALMRLAPTQLADSLRRRIDDRSRLTLPKLTVGIDGSPGFASGRLAFSSETAVEYARQGPVILVRKETTPDDIHGMDAADGVVCTVGGKSGHAAVVARGMGLPCVTGAGALHISERNKQLRVSGAEGAICLQEGTWLSIDGSTGEVFAGRAESVMPDISTGPWADILAWADERRTIRVWANADSALEAATARRYGAEGIGLCRIEQLLAGVDRRKDLEALILADSTQAQRAPLERLIPELRDELAAILEAMNGRPVAIRLLDSPLHEFLPPRAELMADIAALSGASSAAKNEMADRYGIAAKDLQRRLPALMRRVEQMHELNPALGCRGCRQGIVHPEIAEAQVRAIAEAAAQVAERGGDPQPRVMIPHVIDQQEVEFYRRLVSKVGAKVFERTKLSIEPPVGVLVETPRCAVVAHRVAASAEFFTFGTNDLTQLTLGLSRDDYVKFQRDYEERKIYRGDPFETLDEEGVGLLVRMACQEGRRARPSLELGVCGRHASDPRCTGFFVTTGLDYISCSPGNVPVIRVAAAQAAIRAAGW